MRDLRKCARVWSSRMPLPYRTLVLRQPLSVESRSARAGKVAGYSPSAGTKKRGFGGPRKIVTPVSAPYTPEITLPVRPGVMLTRLGRVTTPPGRASEFRTARRWAWVRYCWAFAPPDPKKALRLSAPAFALSENHRQALSEELGVALSLEVVDRYLRSGRPAGTTVEPVDVDDALKIATVGGMALGRAPMTKMRPDYMLIRRVPGSPPEIFALECKGKHSRRVGIPTLHKAAHQVQGLQLAPPGTLPGGPGWAAPDGLIGAVRFDDEEILVELYDPPGDERWNGEPANRSRRSEPSPIARVNLDGSAVVLDAARFRRLLMDLADARLLTLAGRPQAAAERLSAWPGDERRLTPGGPVDYYRDQDLGDFDGARVRLPLAGSDAIEIFLGVERGIADALQADDEAESERALTLWRNRIAEPEPSGDGAFVTLSSSPENGVTIALGDGVLMHAYPRSVEALDETGPTQ